MFRHSTRLALAAALLAPAVMPAVAHAQTLVPKRTLALPAPGCLRVTPNAAATSVRPDVAEARRVAAQAREAALAGDRAAARDAFARAAALNRNDEQLAYDFGRASEELNDGDVAVREYCRYLTLAPNGRQAADVQARILRISPPSVAESARHASEEFDAGLSSYDRGRYADAVAHFDRVLREVPQATEATYDRGLARAALGERANAVRDLEAYLGTAQTADDRTVVLRAIDALRRPTYSAGTALSRGLVFPGLGQFYTGRPALGVLTLGAVGGAAYAAIYERTVVKQKTFRDAFGVPYTQAVREQERPYTAPAIGAGAAVWLLAALEARHHAAGTRSVTPVVTPRSTGLRFQIAF